MSTEDNAIRAARCPISDHHCPTCGSHPQPDKTEAVYENLPNGRQQKTDIMRLYCYNGHKWETRFVPPRMITA